MIRKMKPMLLFLMSLLMIFVVACSGNNGGSGSSPSPSNGGGSGENDGDGSLPQVTIQYWVDPRFQFVEGLEDQTPNYGDWEKIQAQKFMDMHPHVNIEVQALTWEDMGTRVPISITSGSPPDVLRDYLGRTAQYAHQGVLENLEDYIPQEELDDYLPDYLEMYTINGHLHALPAYAWISAMVVNRALWEQQGAADLLPNSDDPTWSFDQLDEAIRAINAPNVFPLGVQIATSQGDNGLLGWFWGHGAQFFKDGDYSKTALNSPEAVAALERLKQYNDEGLLQPSAVTAANGDLETYLYQGQLGIFAGQTQGIWSMLENAQKEGRVAGEHELQMVKQPDVDGVESGVLVGPTSLAVFKQEDDYKREWVIEFVRFLNSTEYQKEYAINAGQFPTRISAQLEDLPEESRVAQELMAKYGAEDNGLTTPHFAELRVLLQPMVQSVILGQKTPEEALAEYESEANRILSGE
ncbi:extracellular solute-binding protein [Paenibacillus senegalensis]|uniref:extracellular solute-binding protein n=1 Tax=Paenibacillus senegalensis TaxID=1465766 RepID=UPI000288244F|nr:extracellular solute-binding protein [Paenibacillus senegalensis]